MSSMKVMNWTVNTYLTQMTLRLCGMPVLLKDMIYVRKIYNILYILYELHTNVCFRPCETVYIPENVDNLFNIHKIKQIQQQLETTIEKLENAIKLRRTCLQDVLIMVDNAGKKLETFTEQIINTVTALKQNTQPKLDALRQKLVQVLTIQTTSLTEELGDAKHAVDTTKRATTDSNNQSQQIVCSSLAALATHKSNEVNKRLECPDVADISFIPYATHDKLFGSLMTYNAMGDFKAVHIRNRDNASSVNVEMSARRMEKTKTRLYKIKRKEKRDTGMAGDQDNSNIYGSCSLQDGTILLADSSNDCVKRLTPLVASPSDSLQLDSQPFAICNINEQEAVVTLPNLQQICRISLGLTMKTTQSFNVDFECDKIAYHDGELFITNETTVYVYNFNGERLRQFPNDKSREQLFYNIYDIAISACGHLLFVADWYNGLLAVDSTTGRKVWQYNEGDLVNATGVCIDGCGSVFVCGYYSHNVLQFIEDGEKLGEVVKQTDGILNPESLCFDKSRSTLVFTKCDESNGLLRFTLTRK